MPGPISTRIAIVFSAFIGPAVAGAQAAAADAPRPQLVAGDIAVTVTPRPGGLRIVIGGIDVVGGSELVVTRPPWAPHFYVGPTEKALAGAEIRTVDGAQQLQIKHHGENDSFTGTETITLHADRRVEQVFEGRLHVDDEDALIQWRAGALNPVLIVGRPYEAELNNGETVRGTVPVTAVSADRRETTLAADFRTITFDTRIGPFHIEARQSPRLIVYDFRKDRWANPDNPLFWFGDLGTRFSKGQPVRYHIVYHLPPAGNEDSGASAVQARVTTQAVQHVQTYPAVDELRVVPTPKEVRRRDGICDVTAWALRPPAEIAGGPDAPAAIFAHYRAWLFEFLPPEYRRSPSGSPKLDLALPAEAGLPEGTYVLHVTPDAVRVQAADPAGFRHAVQSLKQLTTIAPDGRVILPCLEIRDWPSLPVRGVHCFTGGQGSELHERLIRNIVAALKMNHIVLECEYTEWDSHPEIHHPRFGMPKAEVRRVLDLCRELGVTVTPLVNSLGHCQWMFETGHNLDLAEDPDAKWAYCVTNPATYDFLFEIYEEALALFNPRWFHIGHDEYDHRGRVPYRESSKPYTPQELFMMDTLKLHGWLNERGVRTVMWGDMLLAKNEAPDAGHAKSPESAAALREELPDDVLITDWHYIGTPPESFTSLRVFHDEGHETIASTWYRPQNIVNFAQAAHAQKSLGLLQTTWAGYSLDPESFTREMHQYAAWVLAAEAAWNAERPPPADGYPAMEHFLRLMGLSAIRPALRDGWLADLSAAYNVPRAADGSAGWFGLGPPHDLSALPRETVTLRGVTFRLAPGPAGGALVLRSRLTRDLDLPAVVTLELNARADGLFLLHATNFACAEGAPVGTYELTYDDGTTAARPLTYGQNIAAYGDAIARPEAPVAWRGMTAAGEPVALRLLVWENPHPERPIRSLTLRSGDAPGALMVFGLSGWTNGARPQTAPRGVGDHVRQ